MYIYVCAYICGRERHDSFASASFALAYPRTCKCTFSKISLLLIVLCQMTIKLTVEKFSNLPRRLALFGGRKIFSKASSIVTSHSEFISELTFEKFCHLPRRLALFGCRQKFSKVSSMVMSCRVFHSKLTFEEFYQLPHRLALLQFLSFLPSGFLQVCVCVRERETESV